MKRLVVALLLVLYASPAGAYPVVAATGLTAEAVDVTAGNPHSINLPSGIVSGDLLIVIMGCRGVTNSVNALSGWTELTDSNTSTALLWIAYRVATGSEGSTIAPILAVTDTCGAVSFRITGQHASSAPEVGTPSSDGTGASASPDPPSLNPTNWVTEDTLWIAAAGVAFNATCTGFPSGYTDNNQTQASSGATPGAVCAASKNSTAASEDPGIFTLSGANSWVSNTIAVRPAAVTGRVIPGGGLCGGGVCD